MTVNQKIRILRKEKGMTVAELADAIGVDHSTIVRYENGGVRRVPEAQLEKIAGILDCSVENLTDGDFNYTGIKNVSPNYFTEEEKTLIYKYRKLPVYIQNTIKEMCDWPLQ